MVSANGSLRRFHHFGYVVESIDRSAARFVTSLGATWDEKVFADPIQLVRVTFLSITSGEALLELVEPNDERSPVIRFLKERGEGLHHVCYEVDSLDSAIPEMRKSGALMVKPPQRAVAFGGRRIAWVLAENKLLLELLE